MPLPPGNTILFGDEKTTIISLNKALLVFFFPGGGVAWRGSLRFHAFCSASSWGSFRRTKFSTPPALKAAAMEGGVMEVPELPELSEKPT